MMSALGARLLDASGHDIPDGGGPLTSLHRLDLSGLHPGTADATMTVACDVDNPLTGPAGAAAVYGPQKGADLDMVASLELALETWAEVVAATTGADLRDTPGAGAAGGVGFAAISLLGARLRPGADVVQELTGLEPAIQGADLVLTGEGSLDEQTLRGKAPAGVAAAARRAGVPVVAVAGRCLLDAEALARAGIGSAYALTDEASYAEEPFDAPGPLLARIGARIALDALVGDDRAHD
jgi:glycerate kinase